MAFAKLFDTPQGQIVAIKDADDEGSPIITFLFEPVGEIKGEISVGYSSSDRANEHRDQAFDRLSIEAAIGLRDEWMRHFQHVRH